MEDQKIIINIGRQIGSGGRLIAKKLSEELNFSFYDRELLNLAAHESGFSEKFFEQADEHKGFFKSLLNIHIPLIGESNFYKNDLSQESLYKVHLSKYWSLKKHYQVFPFDINNLSEIKCRVFDDFFSHDFTAKVFKIEDFYFAIVEENRDLED